MVTPPTRIRALLIEDNDELRLQIEDYLRLNQLDITGVADMASARVLMARHTFDVIILDLLLGDEDGLSLAREIGLQGGPPVIITSARGDEADRVLGLEMGADDYLAKPFSLRELLARIRVVCRRRHQSMARSHSRTRLLFGTWRLDLASRTAMDAEGHVVELTGGEFELLRAFLDHPHRVLSRSQLLSLTNHSDAVVFERTIDVLINRLRHKLEADPHRPRMIQTIRRAGYRMSMNVVPEEAFD